MTSEVQAVTGSEPIIRADGEGERRWFAGGGIHTWKATAIETGGALLAFEEVVAGGKATPLHAHPGADEVLYVIEGEIAIDIGGRQRHLGPGGFSFAPSGAPHAFSVLSAEARILTVQTPGAGDAFYRAASDVSGGEGTDGSVDLGRVVACAHATGTTSILGPPPSFA